MLVQRIGFVALTCTFTLIAVLAEPESVAQQQCEAEVGAAGAGDSHAPLPLRSQWRPPVQVASSPRIFVVDNLFTREECEELIAVAQRKGMTEAKIMAADATTKADNRAARRSLTTVLGVHGRNGAAGDPVVATWRERMSNFAMLPQENAEALAVTQYLGGEDHKYELHFDSSLQVGRVATVLVFLTDVQNGGDLLFPWAKTSDPGNLPAEPRRLEGVSGSGRDIMELEGVTKEPPIAKFCDPKDLQALKIAPRVGRAVVFFTHLPDLRREGYRAMHAGCPPRQKGEDKWIAQLFIKWHDANGPNGLAQLMQAVGQQWRVDLLR